MILILLRLILFSGCYNALFKLIWGYKGYLRDNKQIVNLAHFSQADHFAMIVITGPVMENADTIEITD